MYDELPMRPLLNAVADLWDTIQTGYISSLRDLEDQDFMRSPNAGVRFLLEKSECLIPEAPLVKKYDVIRRLREALIADLLFNVHHHQAGP
ncbi:unnamed protein product [Penicillium discolor]